MREFRAEWLRAPLLVRLSGGMRPLSFTLAEAHQLARLFMGAALAGDTHMQELKEEAAAHAKETTTV